MGCRAVIFVVAVAACLFYYGWQEYRLSRGTSAEPQAITIEEIEKGIPTNPYRTIGEHIPLYQLVIYSKEKNGTKVNYAYYPIISKARLQSVALDLAKKHGGRTDKITGEEFASKIDVRVLVKTTAYGTVDELKTAIDKETFPSKDLTGLVVNEVSSLGTKEKEMLKQSYSGFDDSKVVIFERGRKPSSASFSFILMGLGGAVGLLGLCLPFLSRGSGQEG